MNPKVFISYSWHPEENKVRVQRLAERLMGDGEMSFSMFGI